MNAMFDEAVAAVAESLQRSTVNVRNGRSSAGSGVIWSSDGLIVTNAHVATRRTARIELYDGRTFEGMVVEREPRADLAALRIEASDLNAVTVRDSATLRVGEIVVAAGNPLGLRGSVSAGIVHGPPGRWVSADVRLGPGSSGGPLADAMGRLVGVNSMSVAGAIAIAVSSTTVRRFLREAQPVQLGVAVAPVTTIADGREYSGYIVLDVRSGSVASGAGFLIGDVLVTMREHDDRIEVTAVRAGRLVQLTVNKEHRPHRAA